MNNLKMTGPGNVIFRILMPLARYFAVRVFESGLSAIRSTIGVLCHGNLTGFDYERRSIITIEQLSYRQPKHGTKFRITNREIPV